MCYIYYIYMIFNSAHYMCILLFYVPDTKYQSHHNRISVPSLAKSGEGPGLRSVFSYFVFWIWAAQRPPHPSLV